MLLSVQDVEKHYGTEEVFTGVSCTLDEGHKVALVGRNGTGKSTLIRIIAGLESANSGEVVITGGRTISHLPQEVQVDDERTGIAYIQEGSDIQPHQFFPILEGLGVSQAVAEQRLSEMSGGQQTKILLTRFLLEPSDIMLLDEPTNNLDIPALLWLEAYLARSKKTMIIVSHDLMFLDAVTNRVFELRDGTLHIERGSYSDYLERKKKDFERQMREYTRYTEEVARLEESGRAAAKQVERGDILELSDTDKYIARAGMDRASASQRRSSVLKRRIKRIDKVEKPFEEEPFTLELNARQTEGDIEIVLDDAVAGYTDGTTVGPISLTLGMGDRVCLMGMNGEGKSTVLKTIAGTLPPLSGTVSRSDGIVLGDMMQQHERADRNERAYDFFIQQTDSTEEEAMHQLKRAGFAEQAMRQQISGLSSGMRARLLFAVFIALGVNVLLLDEPTNHLDIEAVAALKKMLAGYPGIVLLVSHNRWFFDGLDIGMWYEVAEGTLKRIERIEQYVDAAQKRAESITKRLSRII